MRVRVSGLWSRSEANQPMLSSESGPPKEVQSKTNQPGPTDSMSSLPGQAIKPTRASRAWIRIFPSLILLAALLIFIFQNLGSAKITFVTLSGTIPLALALLAAAALGGLLVLVLGSIRIAQLRKLIHSNKSPGTSNDESNEG